MSRLLDNDRWSHRFRARTSFFITITLQGAREFPFTTLSCLFTQHIFSTRLERRQLMVLHSLEPSL